jgi:mRNA interferase RelE/StbE
MTYSVLIRKSAQKVLSRIPSSFRDRIIEAIGSLATTPRPHGAKKLSGRDAWRIRVADYRIIYEIHDERLVILVVAIGHRGNVYR